VNLEEKDVEIYFILFILRLYMNDYCPILIERVLDCVDFILRNIRALNLLYLKELFGNLSY